MCLCKKAGTLEWREGWDPEEYADSKSLEEWLSKRLVVVRMRYVHVFELAPMLFILFEEVIEPLGQASLAEVCHRG